MLHVMSAAAKGSVISATRPTRPASTVHDSTSALFDGRTGELLSLMQADYLGQVRTGAASGVATKYLANPDAGDGRLLRQRQAGPHAGAGRVCGPAGRSGWPFTAAPRKIGAGSPMK